MRIAGVNVETGKQTRYHITRDTWGVHFNSSRDNTLFAGDGGDHQQQPNQHDVQRAGYIHCRVVEAAELIAQVRVISGDHRELNVGEDEDA